MAPRKLKDQVGFAVHPRRWLVERFNNAAPEAVGVLESLMRDPAVPARVRVDAAKAILDRSGHVAGAPGDADAASKSMPEMTPSELAELIERLEREKMARAVLVGEMEASENSKTEDFSEY